MRRTEESLRLATYTLLGVIALAPFLGEGSLLHEAFAPLCHQMPSRSPWLFGVPLPVCWRCFGVYVGVALLAFAWRRDLLGDRRAWPWLLILGVSDVVLNQLGLVADVGIERFVSGACIGIALPLALRAGLRKLLRAQRGLRTRGGSGAPLHR